MQIDNLVKEKEDELLLDLPRLSNAFGLIDEVKKTTYELPPIERPLSGRNQIDISLENAVSRPHKVVKERSLIAGFYCVTAKKILTHFIAFQSSTDDLASILPYTAVQCIVQRKQQWEYGTRESGEQLPGSAKPLWSRTSEFSYLSLRV